MADAAGKTPDPQTTKSTITIPSYDQVFAPFATSSSYNPPSTFSQAFSFLKSTDFYSPPPAAPSPAPPVSSAPEPSPPVSASGASGSASSSGPTRNSILVSHRQKGNPLLKHIRNVRWAFADVVCDYQLGQSSCALYISLRYHLLHSDYLYFRIRELQKSFKLSVVLCHIDVEDVVKPLLEVTRTAMLHECTLLCAWSLEECARYLETLKVYENKSSDSIREQMDTDYMSRLSHALTSIRHVNKTDVVTLGSAFGSLSGIMDASMEDLARCPGIGERKVKRLHDTFHEPFRRVSSRPAVAIPETPSKDKGAEESNPSNEIEEVRGKQPVVKKDSNLRSALDAAFAKYAKKVKKDESKNVSKDSGEERGKASKDVDE